MTASCTARGDASSSRVTGRTWTRPFELEPRGAARSRTAAEDELLFELTGVGIAPEAAAVPRAAAALAMPSPFDPTGADAGAVSPASALSWRLVSS